MKGTLPLIRNELFKLRKKTSFKVIAILSAIFIVLSPTVSFLVNLFIQSAQTLDTPEAGIESFETMLENRDQFSSEAERLYFMTVIDSYAFFADNGIRDWRYTEFYSQYEEALLLKIGLQAVKNGHDISDVASNFYILNDFIEYGINGEPTVPDIDFLISEASAAVSAIGEAVLTASAADYFGALLEEREARIEGLEEALAAAEADFAASPTEENKYIAELAQAELDAAVDIRELMKFAKDSLISPDGWRYNLIKDYEANRNTLASFYTVPLSEKMFGESSNSDGGMGFATQFDSYEDYTDDFNESKKSYTDAVTVMKYAIEHNIPLPQTLAASAKLTWQSNLTSFMSTLAIFAVILAGSSISGEHSGGTVRLLLIRPKKRYKILFSVMAAVWAVVMLIALAAYFGMFLLNLAFGAVGDIFTPDLFVLGGKTVEISPFITTFIRMLVCSLTPIFMVSLAFFFSAVTKKTSAAIALPLVYLYAIAGIGQTVGLLLSEVFDVIKYTPLPYLDMSVFNAYPISNYLMNSACFNLSVFSTALSAIFSPSLRFPIGIAYTAAATALTVICTFAVFNRQEIKA